MKNDFAERLKILDTDQKSNFVELSNQLLEISIFFAALFIIFVYY